jgi:hypothetical protein
MVMVILMVCEARFNNSNGSIVSWGIGHNAGCQSPGEKWAQGQISWARAPGLDRRSSRSR